jgi:hypothetical protein
VILCLLCSYAGSGKYDVSHEPTTSLLTYRSQTIAEPMLYTHINLTWRPEDLKRLARTIRASTLPLTSRLGRFKLGDWHSSKTYTPSMITSDLIVVLIEASKLKVLYLPAYVLPAVMEVVSQISRLPLRDLTLSLNNDSSMSLVPVGALKNLVSLGLQMSSVRGPIPQDIPSWRLPSLTSLSVHAFGELDNSFALFLSTCHFESLKVLEYDVILGENGDDYGDALAQFLKECTKLHCLVIAVANQDVYSAIPSSLRKLTIWGERGQIIPLIPSTVSEVVLDGELDEEAIWHVLDATIRLESATNLKSIQICSNGSSFYWVRKETDVGKVNWKSRPCAIIGRMLRYSFDLAPKGIALLDTAGKTVADYFTES